MVEQVIIDRESLDKEIENAFADENLPFLYFNSFINSISAGDVLLILKLRNKPIAKVSMSFTLAKTLAQKLGAMIELMEEKTGHTIMTTDEISIAVNKLDKGSDNGNGS